MEEILGSCLKVGAKSGADRKTEGISRSQNSDSRGP